MPENFESVSVVIATYNGAKFLEDFLDSIARQEMLPTEVIVTDDCSSDETESVIRAYANRLPIRFGVNDRRLGVVGNFERAISQASGDFIAIADQDDIWAPNKLRELVLWARNAEAKRSRDIPILVFSDLELYSSRDKCGIGTFFRDTGKRSTCESALDFLVTNHIPGCAMLVNRALLNRCLPFPGDLVMHDWWIALCASAGGEIVYVDKPLVKYRQHEGNVVGAPVAPSFRKKIGSLFLRSLGADDDKKRSQSTYAQKLFCQIHAFRERFGGVISNDVRDAVDGILCGRRNLWQDLVVARRNGSGAGVISLLRLLGSVRRVAHRKEGLLK